MWKRWSLELLLLLIFKIANALLYLILPFLTGLNRFCFTRINALKNILVKLYGSNPKSTVALMTHAGAVVGAFLSVAVYFRLFVPGIHHLVDPSGRLELSRCLIPIILQVEKKVTWVTALQVLFYGNCSIRFFRPLPLKDVSSKLSPVACFHVNK
jgi:hypothetical protein